jgi:uroporphyrin-III C-methyltransferase / precorrin-2 dehydrogenase / sirohydrochlorin ferrochelatase
VYPVMLDLHGRRCLVVGGGGVALRKVEGLLAEGAAVTVVASQPIPEVVELAGEGRLELEERDYREGDVAGYTIVFTATDDSEVNRRVSYDAQAAGLWVNSADDPERCTFHLPARVQRGPFQLAIASRGDAPFAVRRVRQHLERRFGPEWAEWIEAAGRFRQELRDLDRPLEEMEAAYDTFFTNTFDADQLAVRVPGEEEMRKWLPGASEELRATEIGFVSLVGAGPGDPGLLTLRARERLLAADIVVYDRLAEPALPCDLPASIELRCVGKQADLHPVPQEEINALLVRLAQGGSRVVRLKGGDPFVFGRGGEEAEELVRAGIPFEVVPCVTAGIAAPAYAGIPVTHRGEAVRLTIVTAHEAEKSDGPQVRWDLLAADPHATILGYMGVSRIGVIVEQLLEAGMDPDTPAAMIQQGTTSAQRVVRSRIADFPEQVKAAGLKPPALFVIGPTVNHAETLAWFGAHPLSGERLVLFAPGGKSRAILEQAGAEIVELPLLITPAARVVMNALPLSGCILRTAGEVESLHEERNDVEWPDGLIFWCLGSAAAERARELGWKEVVELEEGLRGEPLLNAIQSRRD